jgi:hypothetical protein
MAAKTQPEETVIENLTKTLVSLYEEPARPDKPIEFIQKKLGGRTEAEFVELEQKYQAALAEIQELKTKLKNRH